MIILCILYRRASYTARCLQSISKMHGIENCKLYFQIDPGWQAVIRQAYNWKACPKSVVINKERLGCNKNIYAGLERAFNDSDTVMVMEDDVEIYPDFLEFANREDWKNDESINAVRAQVKHAEPILNPDWAGFARTTDFCPWGWLSWRRSWEKFRHCWADNDVYSWDWCLHHTFFTNNPDSVIRPLVGRASNYGSLDGTYCQTEAEFYQNNFTPYWAGKLS